MSIEVKMKSKSNLPLTHQLPFTVYMIDHAPSNCLNAQNVMISGATKEIIVKYMRNHILAFVENFRPWKQGIFGCTETQVHANVVAKQLHKMLQSVRSADVPVAIVISGGKSGVGAPETLGERVGKADIPAL